jgi:signal transduction histidine kinase/ActR/RegA family two-component response regulator
LFILTLLVVLLIVGATVEQLFAVRSAILADTTRQMSRLDMVFAEQTGRAVETVDFILRDAIEALQRLRSAPPDNAEPYNGYLDRRLAGVRQAMAIVITDAAGHIQYSAPSPGITELPAAALPLLAAEAARPDPGLLFSEPLRAPDGKWTALMVRRMSGPGGSFAGIAIAYLNLAYFEDFYKAVELTENGAILLHLRDGTVLARYPHNDAIVGQSYADLPPFKDILSHEMAGTVLMDSPLDGRRRVLAIRALKLFPLAVNVSVEEDKVLAAWRQQTWYSTGLALLALAAIVTLLLTLAKRSRQVEALVTEFQGARDAAEHANRRLTEQMEERERAEVALRQAQRVEAVGQLTGGVAHDFNNLLTVLIGNIDLIQATAPGDPQTAQRLAAMRRAAERGATLTGHLLAFARRQPLLPRAVNLNTVITGMQDLLDSALGGRVRLDLLLADDLWQAMVDPTQIELVILNLAINARDAMPQGGIVAIETLNWRGPLPHAQPAAPATDCVVVAVRDTGTGMTPEVQAKAFEPFFTTKAPGSGSGLGLSQVFGTARQSGGDVHIDSTPGQGTTVSVYLPRANIVPERPPVAVAEAERAARVSHAVVLLVDDDEEVRTTTGEILGELGYTVLQAASGDAALELLRAEGMIDVLLTDLAMPGMTGAELARRVRETHPFLPIVFISGYADPEGLAGDVRLHRLVRKPYRPAELRDQLEAALREARAPAA